ncbi:MAG TPA: hypothetical protein VLD59_15490 [Steroidobacteraceae bacterium]|nr:hypothetical protein [Steroidobacteraceae bacterium]
MHTRRKLLIVLAATLLAPRVPFAQAKKQPVLIGWLSSNTREMQEPAFAAFKCVFR